jgi:tetratricopeptide (TPR) repeat protein
LGGALYTLSNILTYKGAVGAARDCAAQAIDWSARRGDRYFLTYTHLYASINEHSAGNLHAAEEHARAALDLLENSNSLRPFAQALLARVQLGRAELSLALPLARAAYQELRQLGQVQDGEVMICVVLAECLWAVSDFATAREVARNAIERLYKRAESISVENWRASFLRNIPEHRRLLELADAIGVGN